METAQPHWEHAQLAAYVPASARTVLDCTPEAGFAAAAGLAGRTLFGLDFSPGDSARPCDGYAEVVSASLDDTALPFDEGQLDCVVCDDVLALARDPAPLLRELARTLTPGGLAVLTLPNLQYYRNVTGLAEGQWRADTSRALSSQHLRYFTAYESAMLLGKAGLKSPVCEVLVGDRPEDVPLNEDGCIVHGRVTIGPLSRDEYIASLAQQYLVLAAKPLGR